MHANKRTADLDAIGIVRRMELRMQARWDAQSGEDNFARHAQGLPKYLHATAREMYTEEKALHQKVQNE